VNHSDKTAPVKAHFTGAEICMEKARLVIPNFGMPPLGVGLAIHTKDFRGAPRFSEAL
jgi:hypothetical protein